MKTAAQKIEDEVVNHYAKEMAREIDFEVMSSFLIEDGWSKVVLSPMVQEQSEAVDKWLSHHCPNGKGCMHMGLVFLFKDQKTANWFALTWL